MNNNDLNASHYTQHSSLQHSHADEILSKLHVGKNAKVLDVGCGDGSITAEIAKKALEGSVVGLDASKSMIDYAVKEMNEGHYPLNLQFQLSPVEDADLPLELDLITSFSCFHWLKNPTAVIDKLLRSLKEDGKLFILTYPKDSPYYGYLENALEKYPEYQGLSSNKTMLSTEDYRGYFAGKDLQVEVKEETVFAEYQNQEELRSFIEGWVFNYVPMPKDVEPQFIQDVIQAILDDPSTQRDGKIQVPYKVLTMGVIKVKKEGA